MKKACLLLITLLITGYLTTQNSANLSQTGELQQASLVERNRIAVMPARNQNVRLTQPIVVTPNDVLSIGRVVTPVAEKAQLNKTFAGNSGEITKTGTDLNSQFNKYILLTQIGNLNQSVQFSDAPDQQMNQTIVGIQFRNKNELYQYAGGSSAILVGMMFGNENKLTQISYGNQDRSVALVAGDRNRTDVIQRNGDQNTVNLLQTGGSYSYIKQEGTLNQLAGAGLNLFGSFTGTGAILDVIQNNGNNRLGLLSDGNAIVFQNGSDEAIINETGGGTVYVNQLSDYNLVVLNHTGSGLSSFIQLTDTENQIKLNHNNNGNAVIVQDGSKNVVAGSSSIRTGNDSDENLNQSMIYASAAQFSGDRLEVDQTGNANRLQLNANGNVNVRQYGNSNLASVTQSAF